MEIPRGDGSATGSRAFPVLVWLLLLGCWPVSQTAAFGQSRGSRDAHLERALRNNLEALKNVGSDDGAQARLWSERAGLLARAGLLDGARHAVGAAHSYATISGLPGLDVEVLFDTSLVFNELEIFEDAAEGFARVVSLLGERAVGDPRRAMLEDAHFHWIQACRVRGLDDEVSRLRAKLERLVEESGRRNLTWLENVRHFDHLAQESLTSGEGYKEQIGKMIEAHRALAAGMRRSPATRENARKIEAIADMLEEMLELEGDAAVAGYMLRAAKDPRTIPELRLALGLFVPIMEQVSRGREDRALRAFGETLKALQGIELPSRLQQIKGLIAVAGAEGLIGNRPAAAVPKVRRALDLLEAYSEEMRFDESLVGFNDDFGHRVYRMAAGILARVDEKEAFSCAERGRAWALRRLLGDPRRGSTPGIAGERALEPIAAVSIERLQEEVLSPGQTLLAFFRAYHEPGSQEWLAWIIDRERVEMVRIPIPHEEEVRCQIAAASRSRPGAASRVVRGTRGVEPLAACDGGSEPEVSLYELLIAPLVNRLRPQLIIVPHGVLHHVPFTALRDPHTGRRLIRDFTVSVVPSASALALLVERGESHGGENLVLGDPATELAALPGARREALRVAELAGGEALLGEAAAESRIHELAGRIRLLHVAAHGRHVAEDPRQSHMLLAAGEHHDGALEVREVWDRLDLRGTELVVLSGCQTALGEITRGEDLIDPARAFLVAGSRAVISTLWPVDDAASAELMSAFYERWLDGAATVAEALREAQLETLENERFAAPYYWAAFTLSGDPGIRFRRGEAKD